MLRRRANVETKSTLDPKTNPTLNFANPTIQVEQSSDLARLDLVTCRKIGTRRRTYIMIARAKIHSVR
jgi:hypothetical protein